LLTNHALLRRLLALIRLLLLYCLICAFVLAAGLLRRAGWEAGAGLNQPLPLPTAPGANVPSLGVTVHLEQQTAAQRQAGLADLRAAGFGWVRQRFDWGLLEPQAGVYVWERADQLIGDIVAAGMLPVVVLDGSPAWARAPEDQAPTDNPFAPPADPMALARFAAVFAARYGEQVRFYQVWDEPNIAPHWGNRLIEPVAYAQLLKAAAQAIRSADRDAVVLAAALAPTTDRGHAAIDEVYFLQRMVAAGAASAFDVVALQPFGFGHAPGYRRQAGDILDFQRAAFVRRALVEMGLGEKPVWAVRIGWNRRPNATWGAVTPADQAQYVTTARALARTHWPWLATLGWASDRADAPADDPRWGFALYEPGGNAAPVMDAIRQSRAREAAWGATLAIGMAGSTPPAGVGWIAPLLLAGALLVVVWRGWAAARCVPWPDLLSAFRRAPWPLHLSIWVLLLGVYYFATWPPLLGLCWLAWALLCLAQPAVGLGLAAALAPFYFQHKEVHLVNVTVAVPPASAALLCLAPALVWRSLRRRFRFCSLDWAMLAMLGISLLAIVNVWHWPAYGQGLVELVLVPVGLWFAVRVLAWGDARLRLRLALALFAGGVLVAIWGGVTWLGGQGVAVDGVRRLVGPHFSPNQTALYLVRTFFLGLGLTMAMARPWRWGSALATALVLIALVFTGSRGALLMGVPAGLLLFGWLALRRQPGLWPWLRRRRSRLRWGGAALFILLGVAVVLLWERLLNGQTLALRLDLWETALRLWRDHWLVGVGPGGFFWTYPAYLVAGVAVEPNQLHPHNFWLELGSTWGVLGFVWVGAVVVWGIRAPKSSDVPTAGDAWLAAGLAAAFVAAIAHAQVDAFFLLPDLAVWNALAWGLLCATRGRCEGEAPKGWAPAPGSLHGVDAVDAAQVAQGPTAKPGVVLGSDRLFLH